jgi:outer membrane protein assembly factor BamB
MHGAQSRAQRFHRRLALGGRRVLPIAAAVAIWLASGAAEPAAAGQWPQFQGPSRDNKSTETGLLKKWPAGRPRLLWSAKDIGYRGFSSVSIAGGLIYTAGSRRDKIEYVTALDLDGRIRWQTKVGPAYLRSHGGSRATPTFADGDLYHLGGLGRLLCLEAKTGRRKYVVDITKQYGGKSAFWGFTESVLVVGDKVLFTPGGKNVLVALSRKTGEQVWITRGFTSWAAMCSPIAVEYGGQRLIVTMTAKYVICVDAATGTLLWRYRHKTQGGNHVTTPVHHDGRIYCTSGYGAGGVRLDLAVENGKVTYQRRWVDKTLDNHHGGVVLVDGFLYGTSYKGKWVCLDFQTGQPRWTAKGVGKGALTYADGMLYCLGESGTLALVEATPTAYRQVSRFQLPSGGEREYWARPVVLDGRLYIRHADTLFAYDIRAAAASRPSGQ